MGEKNKVEIIIGCATARPFLEVLYGTARLALYRIDMKYIRNLAKVEGNVLSVSPQIGKDSRPFIGIVIVCNETRGRSQCR